MMDKRPYINFRHGDFKVNQVLP